MRIAKVSLAAFSIILGLMATVSAQSLQLPSIVTVGLGYVVVQADRVVVALSIETQDEAAEQATALNGRIVDDIRQALVSLQPEGLEFVPGRVNLWQQRSTNRPTVHRATSTLNVYLGNELDAGRVIDTAMRLGATAVLNVKFHATDIEAAAKQALTLAVQDAMAKAEAISKATETRVVTIRRVTDANKIDVFNPSDPVLVEWGGVPKTPYQLTVERGEILVQVEVTMEFDLAAL